jgi:hypothetical protein
MGTDRAWKDEFTLLCELCGYVVEGLPAEGACPECGKPIVESLPERRVAFQRSDLSLRSWLEILTRPVRTLDTVRIDTHRASTRWSAIIAAGGIGAAGWVIGVGFQTLPPWPKAEPSEKSMYWLTLGLGGGIAWFLFLTIMLVVMTKTEEIGLRIIGNRRGYRITTNISRAICDLGSVGWLVASLCGSGAALLAASTEAIPNRTVPLWAYAAVPLAALPGFLFFETFAWLGLRHLKYANRVRPNLPTNEVKS